MHSLLLLAASLSIVVQAREDTAYPHYPESVASFGAAVYDSHLYVYGGHIGKTHQHSRDNISTAFRRLNLASPKRWEELPAGLPLQSPALVTLGDGLFRIGGLEARNPKDEPADLHSAASVDRFDPFGGQWSKWCPLPEPRSSHDAVVVGNRIYIFGGWNLQGDTDDAHWLTMAYVADLNDESPDWQRIADAPFRRRALTVAEQGGLIYAIGGLLPDGTFSHQVDVYDPAANSWSSGPPLPGGEQNGFAASAFNVAGQIYVSGRDGDVYRLNDSADRWEKVTRLFVGRFFHRLLPFGDDQILIVAGAGRERHLASIESIQLPVEPNVTRTVTSTVSLPSSQSESAPQVVWSAAAGESAYLLSPAKEFWTLNLDAAKVERRRNCPLQFDQAAGAMIEQGGRPHALFVGTRHEQEGYTAATYDVERDRWRTTAVEGKRLRDFAIVAHDQQVWLAGLENEGDYSSPRLFVWRRNSRGARFVPARGAIPGRLPASRILAGPRSFCFLAGGDAGNRSNGQPLILDVRPNNWSTIEAPATQDAVIVPQFDGSWHAVHTPANWLVCSAGYRADGPVRETDAERGRDVQVGPARAVGWCVTQSCTVQLAMQDGKLILRYFAVP